jgi:hypothetical protein
MSSLKLLHNRLRASTKYAKSVCRQKSTRYDCKRAWENVKEIEKQYMNTKKTQESIYNVYVYDEQK